MKRYPCPLCLPDGRPYITDERLYTHVLIAHTRADLSLVFDFPPTGPNGETYYDSGFTKERRERYRALGSPNGTKTWEYGQWICETDIDRGGRLPGEPGYKYPVPSYVVYPVEGDVSRDE